MNGRLFLIRTFIIIGILVLSIRLFSLQVIEEEYKVAAENNIVQKITEYPYRGYIYDRNNELIVQNEPVYDLSIIPREMDLTDSGKVKSLLNLSQDDFLARYQKARRYSKYLSSIFDEMIPNDVFAQIQDRLVDLKGFNVSTRTVRAYNHQSLANVLGY
ncbi:MAG: peptidoglycan glycosyltransferase, partial [Cyclobacteriaceae bacterium]|nr:peptidoglycan glycosyltransferase [Cyclobacteriaceae bacterium HetDA_MAG_MS6]